MSSLSDWHTRPKRTRHPPPISYWQEYVETDTWYLNKLVEDVPPEEMHAALYDDNLEEDNYSLVGEEGDDEGDGEDSSEDEQSVDNDYTCDEVSDATDELSDGTESEEDSGGESESGGESDTDSTEVLRTSEGQ